MRKNIFLILVLVFILAGCGKEKAAPENSSTQTSAVEETSMPDSNGIENVMVDGGLDAKTMHLLSYPTSEEAFQNCQVVDVSDNEKLLIITFYPVKEEGTLSLIPVPDGERKEYEATEVTQTSNDYYFREDIPSGCYLMEYENAVETYYVFVQFQ